MAWAWAKIPTRWIHAGGLKHLQWSADKGGGIVGLVSLIALSVLRNKSGVEYADTGTAPRDWLLATYDELESMTRASRSLVARGLAVLIRSAVLERITDCRSGFRLVGVATLGDWAMLPQSFLLGGARSLKSLEWLSFRSEAELDALKIYLLMLALRNNKSGFTFVGFDKISEYTGVHPSRVKRAKSLLIAHSLLYAESDTDAILVHARPHLKYTVRGFQMRDRAA